MFSVVLLALFSLFAVSSATFSKCIPGNYCVGAVTQVNTYLDYNACGNQCLSQNKGYQYFTWVSTSKQCQCSTTCSSKTANPGADTYCSSPTVTPTAAPSQKPSQTPTQTPTAAPTFFYTQCWTNKYCGTNANTKTVGYIETVDSCAHLCYDINHNYKFFNLVSNGQCQCNLGCTSLISAQGVNAYSLNNQACVITPPALRG